MSKRLIDANELISAMYYYEHNEGGLTAYDAQDIINKAPSIDIVRCKECKYARNIESEWICEHLSGMAGLNVLVNADDFCSYGEVRDE